MATIRPASRTFASGEPSLVPRTARPLTRLQKRRNLWRVSSSTSSGKIVPCPIEIWAAAALSERCKSESRKVLKPNGDHKPDHGTSRIGASVPCGCS